MRRRRYQATIDLPGGTERKNRRILNRATNGSVSNRNRKAKEADLGGV